MEKLICLKKSAVVAALAVCVTVLAACGGTEPQDVEIEVSLQGKKLSPETLQVGQDDNVTLRIQSDAPGSVHLHGYDIEQEVSPDEVAEFIFVADATGRYRMTFHPASSAGGGHHDGGGHDMPVESEMPVSVSITAEPDEAGGVNVGIVTEGWRWAPEEVNLANSSGAGHAHIYVDGVKINRVYGPAYYLEGLEHGQREIRVALNTNAHEAIIYNGDLAEDTVMVMAGGSSPASMSDHDPDPVAAAEAMSLEIVPHADPLGGYNLQVVPGGFEFTPENAGGDEVSGQGFALVTIDGEHHARMYTPWLKLPGLEAGMREIGVSLVSNQGRPYTWDGNPVQASQAVHAGAKDASGGTMAQGSMAQGSMEMSPGDSMGGGGSGGAMDHSSMDMGAGDAMAMAAEEEYDIGFVEVQPR